MIRFDAVHKRFPNGTGVVFSDPAELNRQVDKDKKDPEDVANAYAEQHGLVK
ncbi:hypothetical protein [Streptomyces sp. NPDC002520]